MRRRRDLNILVALVVKNSRSAAVRMQRTASRRAKLIAAQRHDRHSLLMHMEVSIEQRRVQVLAFARALTMQQRKTYSHRGGDARRNVTDSHSSQRRRTIDLSYAIGYSRVGLSYKIVAGFRRQWSCLPGHRYRTHDNFRIDCFNVFVGESQAVDH